MTILAFIAVANLLATGALGWLVVRRTKRDTSTRPLVAPAGGHGATAGHYWVGRRADDGHHHVEYEGTDSDAAYEAHVRMERDPKAYPGRHLYVVNGETKVSRHHTEMK